MVKKKVLLLHRLSKKEKTVIPSEGNDTKVFRALSAAGSEHLPYKQRVGGSNPSAPTNTTFPFIKDYYEGIHS